MKVTANLLNSAIVLAGISSLMACLVTSLAAPVPNQVEVEQDKAQETVPFLKLVPQLGHKQPVNSVAFSPNGKWMLTGSSDNVARMWETETGRLIRSFTGHSMWIQSVAVSPDGEWVLTGSWDNTARLWEARTGKLIRSFEGHADAVTSVAFSPDGRYLLTGSRDKTARLWETSTGKSIRTLKGHQGGVEAAAFDREGKWVLTCSRDKTIRLWEARTGKSIRSFNGHTDIVYGAVFSRDGCQILSGSRDRTARLWETCTGNLIQTLEGQQGPIQSVAINSDGKRLLTGSWDRTARLWDANSGKLIRIFAGHTERVNSVKFAPDDMRVLTGGSDWFARLWETETGALLRTYRGHVDRVQSVAVSFDGTYVFTGSRSHRAALWEVAETGKMVRSFGEPLENVTSVQFAAFDSNLALVANGYGFAELWSFRAGGPIISFSDSDEGHKGAIHSAAIDPDGKRVLTGGDDNKACLWDAHTGRLLRSFGDHLGPVYAVAFSPDGKHSLTGGENKVAYLRKAETGEIVNLFLGHFAPVVSVAFSRDAKWVATGSRDKTARLWDAQTGNSISLFDGHKGPVQSVAVSPDGEWVLTGSWDNTARLWEARTGKLIRSFEGHADAVTSVAFSPDGRYLLTGSRDKTARLWETTTGKTIRSLTGHLGPVAAVAFNLDDTHVLTGGQDQSILWEISTGRVIRHLKARSVEVESVAFGDNGRWVLAGGQVQTTIWEAESGELIRRFVELEREVNAIAISPDSRLVVTSSSVDDFVRLWSVKTGKPIRTFSGHEGPVDAVAFSPDGKAILTGSRDKTARVWNVETAESIATLEGHSEAVTAVAFSPDGQWLLTGSEDGTVRLWKAQTKKFAKSFPGDDKAVAAVAFSSDSKWVLGGSGAKNLIVGSASDYAANLLDVQTGRQERRFEGHSGSVTSVTFSPNGKWVLTGSGDGTARIWDRATGTCLCILLTLASDSWVVVTPDGRFDTNFVEDLRGFNWLFQDSPLSPYSPEIFTRDYLEPRLLQRLLDEDERKRFPPIRALRNLNRVQPEAAIKPVVQGSEPGQARVTVKVKRGFHSFYEDGRELTRDSGKSLYDVRLFRNGQLVGRWPDPAGVPHAAAGPEQSSRNNAVQRSVAWSLVVIGSLVLAFSYRKPQRRSTAALGLVLLMASLIVTLRPDSASPPMAHPAATAEPDPTSPQELAAWRQANRVQLNQEGTATLTFPVRLPSRSNPGPVEFTAYCFNEDRVKSETAHWTFDAPVYATANKPRAYLLCVGVSDYGNAAFNLEYAAADAHAMAKALSAKGRLPGYQVVPPVVLAVDKAGRSRTKEALEAALELLAGPKAGDEAGWQEKAKALHARVPGGASLASATPDDLVLVSFSGHGYTDDRNEFFLILPEAGPLLHKGERPSTEALKNCVSGEELSQWLRRVDAGEMALVVDACHSAATVAQPWFKPGPMGSRGLGQLAYDKRMRVLAASQADDFALESKNLRHGLLTYALVMDGLEKDKADFRPKDGRMTLGEWLGYGAVRVPELHRRLRAGLPLDDSVPGDSSAKAAVKGVIVKRDKEVPKVIEATEELIRLSTLANKRAFQTPALFDYARGRTDPTLTTTPTH